MADWFVNNYVYTPEIRELHKEYLKSPVSKSEGILKTIRRVRKQNKSVLNYMIDKWQFKEKFTLCKSRNKLTIGDYDGFRSICIRK